MIITVLAWSTIGLGIIMGAPAAAKLAVGGSDGELTPDEPSKAWRDVQLSIAAILGGATPLVKALGSNHIWGWADLALAAGLVLPSLFRHEPDEPDDDVTRDASSHRLGEVPDRPRGPELPLPSAGASARQLADWVERKRFSTTRLRSGYDEEEVDVLLDKIRDTFLGLESAAVTLQEIRSARFTRTHLGPGYVEEEVDTFLADARRRLA